jgi:site-specific recombinase XerD
MLEKSFGLLFFLKRPQVYNGGEMYIYLRITVNGVSKEFSTKRLWHPDRWNPSAGKATNNKEDAKIINKLIDTLNNKAHEARRSLIDDNKDVTAQAIKDLLMGLDDRKMILEIFKTHNEQIEKLVPNEYSASTLDLFKRSLDHTHSFIRWKYKVDDLEIKNLNYEFISQFSFWLKSVRNCQHNTTIKYLTYFKKIVLQCVRYGWLKRDPFLEFKLTKREKERPFLTTLELDAIYKKNFTAERLNLVRDIFVFSYTGLAYADVQKLKRTEIIIGEDGEKWICINRQKTETPSRIPLLQTPLDIIEKYADHPVCKIKDMVLPIITNQKMNAYLKEIADLSSINKELTFHIARHTFATTITLSNGVPIETVSKMLGHKSLKQTQHYAKTLDIKVSADMAALKRVFANR